MASPAKSRLGDDLLLLYKDRKFSDVTLHVQQQTFPVHKNILCARSPVFCAMFEHDTQENRTGIVNITDVDPDTVDKMLIFVYSDAVGLQSESALCLYSAADKYQIVLLRKHCSSYLKSNLATSNVLKVLTLANTYQDLDLRKSAKDFVSVHATDIFRSKEWTGFMTRNAPLAAEVMHTIFAEKGMLCSKLNWVPAFNPMAITNSQIEQVTTSPVRKQVTTSQVRKQVTTPQVSKQVTTSSESAIPHLRNDLLRLFKDRKFSDITLNVQEQTFPVHKTILCARSPVFSAMFEHDTQENRTEIVNISDVDPDTIDRMLTFVYSDVLDVQLESALRLYSAADKYQIALLKNRCSFFLKSIMDVSNVLRVLALADTHQDMDLRNSVRDFVSDHATAVFMSKEWKLFVVNKVHLASELVHHMFVERKTPLVISPAPSFEVFRLYR